MLIREQDVAGYKRGMLRAAELLCVGCAVKDPRTYNRRTRKYGHAGSGTCKAHVILHDMAQTFGERWVTEDEK